jgi:type II secretory pathway pseudopilin PulG
MISMKKKYNSFTLVEVLVVMGILIILTSVGIAVGRFATQRSQDITHRDAAKMLYQALVEFKLENGYYPRMGSCSTCFDREMFATALGYKGENPILKPYVDEEDFDGGADATFYYGVDEYDSQLCVVCVSFGGIDDEMERGFFCVGDGLGSLPEGNPVLSTEIDSQESGDPEAMVVKSLDDSDWTKDSGFAASTN